MKFSHLCMVALMAIPFVAAGCATWGPIFKQEGPALTRTATGIGMHLWLSKTNVDRVKAAEYKTYILEARGLLAQGDVPVSTLDLVSSLLNQKIDNDIVRAVIQQGIETIKTRIVIPSTGFIPDSVKVWVFAVLDGSVDGINTYLAAAPVPASSVGAAPDKTVISFR